MYMVAERWKLWKSQSCSVRSYSDPCALYSALWLVCLAFNSHSINRESGSKLEAKDVLPNINRTQAVERAEKSHFCPWWPWPLDLWPWPSNSSERGTKHVFRVNLVQRLPRYFIKNTNTDWRRRKQNLPQFTACGNNSVQPTVLDIKVHRSTHALRLFC